MNKLLALENRPTAVLTTNFELSIGALKAISEHHLSIPSDISFIGFDNPDVAQVINPGISIVMQPIVEVGTKSVEILVLWKTSMCY